MSGYVSSCMSRALMGVAMLACGSVAYGATAGKTVADTQPRTAVISAFAPELMDLKQKLQEPREESVAGTTFYTGRLEGKPVVLFLSGQGPVNATMSTQLALDRFHVTRIVFSGIAGGVDPDLSIGDVVVPDQWSEYLESIFARKSGNDYVIPDYYKGRTLKNFDMIFPVPVEVATSDGKSVEDKVYFPVDPGLLAQARKLGDSVAMTSCTSSGKCLPRKPRLVVGGTGVSGSVFLDNADFRQYVRSTFNAEAADMESAAIVHVAYLNHTPVIVFRGLSDLAGGGTAASNEVGVFLQLASENSAKAVEAFLKAMP